MAHRRSLGFARDDKGGGGASIWDRLLGSQVSNARPGAPFDFTLRHCRGHKLCHFSPDSPQRVGFARDDKERVGFSLEIGCTDPRSQTERNQGDVALCPLAQPSNLRQKVIPFRQTRGSFCGQSVVCDCARTITSHLQQVSTNRIETMMAR
jgi:hypothetical protein